MTPLPTPSARRRHAVAALCGLAMLAVSACSAVGDEIGTGPTSTTTAAVGSTTTAPSTSAPRPVPTSTTTTTTSTTSTTTSTTVPPTTAPTPGDDATLRRGVESAAVSDLQHRLVDLGFHVPVVDGVYGSLTEQAVLAFQKSAGLTRDGVAGPRTIAALDGAVPPTPREAGDHVEIDLDRQLMFVVRGDRTFVFNTSTGAPGWATPAGRFTITRQIDGMRHAPLGDLWRPKYFNGGIALHGSPSIPGHPASHGCARLHDAVIDLIWTEDLAPIGTPVWVY